MKLLRIRRVNFQILLSFINLKIVDGKRLRSIQRVFHFLVEHSCEFVTVVDAEHTFKEIDIHLDAQILPQVVIGATHLFGHSLSVDENALGNAGVFLAGLSEVDGVVVQVIVQYTGSDTVVF